MTEAYFIDEQKYRHVPVGSSSAFDPKFMHKLWELVHTNQKRSFCGMWEPVHGLLLYANISIHDDFAIHCHNEVSFHAPVVWVLEFPSRRDYRPHAAAETGTITICEMIGETFDHDWIKLMMFSGL